MANQKYLTISGMLNQHEFKERYIFTMQRIMNGFSRPELAFLLGRTTNDVSDYEQLGVHMKMNYQDHEVMAAIFKTLAPASPVFQPKVNDIDVSNDKRMIRGIVLETDKHRIIDFSHPWKIKGENKQITIQENLGRNAAQDTIIFEFIKENLAQLEQGGCFDRGCTALFLYQQLNQVASKAWKPLFLEVLRDTIYAHIYTQKIRVHQVNGQTIYKTKS